MKILWVYIVVLFSAFSGVCQPWEIERVGDLPSELSESSGLEILQGDTLLTHNDSGGESAIFVMSSSGDIIKKVWIANSENNDWEDLCADDKYLYIGDFGNNLGNRRDLGIYRIPKSEIPGVDTVHADLRISFEYGNQEDFSDQRFRTNYDAEALVCYQDELWLFSKNWGNFQTYLYRLSKTNENQELYPADSLNVNCLITGADIDSNNRTLGLVGYDFSSAYYLTVDIESGGFDVESYERTPLETSGSYQVESFIFHRGAMDQYLGFFTSESSFGGPASLYRMVIDPTVGDRSNENRKGFKVYPNPTNGEFRLEASNVSRISICNLSGQTLLEYNGADIYSTEDLDSGFYIVFGWAGNGELIGSDWLFVGH